LLTVLSADSTKWEELRNQTLFTLDKNDFTATDLQKYLEETGSITKFIENPGDVFNEFEATTVLRWEEDHLEGKYPEYRMLLREYREGILYFQLMEDMIWKPAGEDSTGIQEYYTANRDNYRYPSKAQAWVYNVPDTSTMEKLYMAIENDAVTEKEILLESGKSGKIVPVKVSWEDGQESTWKDIPMAAGVYKKVMSDKLYIVEVTDVNDGGYKNLDEIRGLVIADYQKVMEERWVEELKQKYLIERNEAGEKYVYDELVK
jgi:peptidyl-prolyl cis-trans isomerase SurA